MTLHHHQRSRMVQLEEIPQAISTSISCKNSRRRRKYTLLTIVFQAFGKVSLAILICGLLTGCITDATVDLTKAPFDVSTELTDATTGSISQLTDGTSQATTDLTEPTREFLSSTTPGAWFHADGTLNPEHKKIAFIVLNFDNLQEDIAHGGGEYLISLSSLAGIPLHSRKDFLQSTQEQYEHIFEEGQSRPESLRRLIRTLPNS